MSIFSIDIGIGRKIPIAEEVLGSAARILAAAGFSDGEIKALFLQASQGVEDSTASEVGFTDEGEEDDYSENKRYEFEEKFEKLPAYRALQRLAKRFERSWQYETIEDLNVAVDGLKEAVSLGEVAQSWIRQNAPAVGLTVCDSHDAWVKTASDEELDREDGFVFLDDWRFRTPYSWDIASSVARNFARRGMKDNLKILKALISGSTMVFPGDIVSEVESSLRDVELFESFKGYVQSLNGSGELLRSQVTDDFSRNATPVSAYAIDGWLQAIAAEDPSVQVYKRSNRWRIQVG